MAPKPLFLFSLPRSGSTLAQRILGRHPHVSTTAEPWLLLPFIYSVKSKGSFTEYWHEQSTEAMKDFIDTLPGGQKNFLDKIAQCVLRLYEEASDKHAAYFLDKTPRYHLIAEEILEMFPEGKFIFLWRNPLAIASSINETWGNGHWKLYSYKIDLFKGLDNLVATFQQHKDKVYGVRYEDLITKPDETWQGVMDYLDLNFDRSIVSNFSTVQLEGRMGDQTGRRVYSSISDEPLEKWKKTMANPLRKNWCRNYLEWLGEERLRTMGYSKTELLDQLNTVSLSLKYGISDLTRRTYGVFYCLCEPALLRYKIRTIDNWQSVYSHR